MSRMKACQHCNEAFEVAATGRPPKFCSSRCRKAAWEAERFRQAVVVEVAKRMAAERRRENRRNETQEASGNRRNETPSQAGPPVQPELPVPDPRPQTARPPSPLPPGPSLRQRRRLLPPPPGHARDRESP